MRGTSTSSQCAHPLADYCYKSLKYRRMAVIADDFAYGHEMCAGFQRVFEELGGKIVQKMFPPLTVPDYGTYLAQLKTNIDGIFLGFAGSNGFRYLRQFNEYGLRGKVNAGRRHDRARRGGAAQHGRRGARHHAPRAGTRPSSRIRSTRNSPRRSAPSGSTTPASTPPRPTSRRRCWKPRCSAVKGKIEDKTAFMKVLRAVKVDTVRGPVSFDRYGNVVGNVYIRKVERKEGRLVNTVIHTYPNVSQFWTYKPEEFLKNPVYSRDWPPAKNLES